MGIAAYNRGSRAISAYIDQQLKDSREIRLPSWSSGFAKAIRAGQMERDTEAMFQALVEDNESRIGRGLPQFEPTYELAQKALRNYRAARA